MVTVKVNVELTADATSGASDYSSANQIILLHNLTLLSRFLYFFRSNISVLEDTLKKYWNGATSCKAITENTHVLL